MRKFLRFIRQLSPRCGRQAHRGWRSSRPRSSFTNASRLATLALEAGLPTVCEWRKMAEHGCLLGYAPDIVELNGRNADYVARIFRGTSPGDLPIEQPTHFEFAVNLKTANALGLALPPAILARADDVIE